MEKYEELKIEVVYFEENDVITDSRDWTEEGSVTT